MNEYPFRYGPLDSDTGKLSAIGAIIEELGGIDGGHHKQWVLDQVMRIVKGCQPEWVETSDCNGTRYRYQTLAPSPEYDQWTKNMRGDYDAEWDEYEYDEWDEGIAP